MDIKEKLQQFEKKVLSTETPDKDFYNLIGIELYDFIESNDELKNAFLKHSDFLIKLSKEPDFIVLQGNIFEAIQETLKFTDIEEINEIQKVWNNRLINKFTNRAEVSDLTLPETFNLIRDKNSYYKLGDNSYSTQGELSLITPIIPIRNQYELVGAFFKLILGNKIKKEENTALFQEVIKKFGDLINQLDELIYKKPIKLHIKDFEEFIIFCSQIYKRKGYEIFYEFRDWLPPLKTPPEKEEFEIKKKNCLVVIEDLITEINSDDNESNQQNPKKRKLSLVGGMLYGNSKTKALHQMIVEGKLNSIESLKKEIEDLKEKKELTTKISPTKELSQADQKRLFILEKLKEEWDLAPKKGHGKIMVGSRSVNYSYPAGKVKITSKKYMLWADQCGIDHYGFENILSTFQDENLIKHIKSLDMGDVLEIQFPEDFDEIYKKYKASIENENIEPTEIKELKKEKEPENTIDEEQNIEISKTVINKYKDIKIEPKNKRGRLQLKKGGKWIDLGGYNTRTYKMVKYILMPSSKSKIVADVFEHIKIKKDDKDEDLQKETPRSYQLKKEIIEECIDTLQKEEFLKGHIKKPIFDDKAKTVVITFS